MRGQPRISPVYRMAESPEPVDPLAQGGRIEGLRRRAWREHGLVAVPASELPPELRQQLTDWMEQHYG